VDDIRKLLFSLPQEALANKLQKYEAMVPEPLNRQFPDRVSKEDAISRKEERNKIRTHLFPAGTYTMYLFFYLFCYKNTM